MKKHYLYFITLLIFHLCVFGDDVKFTKITLTNQYYTEAVAYGDFNHDGKMDVTSGNYVYIGPQFTQKYQICNFSLVTNIENSWAAVWQEFGYDVNGDGWDDKFTINSVGNGNLVWYENPKNTTSRWKGYTVFNTIDNESPLFTDIDGDNKPDAVGIKAGVYGYVKANWQNPAAAWTFHRISNKGCWSTNTHGLGCGDVNNDGRMDLIIKEGWFEQPASLTGDPVWAFHSYNFVAPHTDCKIGGAQMYAYDVNGDGRNDVITSIEAHGWGLAWFENVKDANSGITFKKHMIMGTRAEESIYGAAFSQPHAVALYDIDGDGLKDVLSGKRWKVHGSGSTDPEATVNPVIYWFQLVRNPDGTAKYIPHLIDDNSGIGVSILCADVNNDGFVDVMAGGKRGAFLHMQNSRVGVSGNSRIDASNPQFFKITSDFLHPFVASFSTPVPSGIMVNIFTVSGLKVRSLAAGSDNRNRYIISWDGRNDHGSRVSAGSYIVNISTSKNSLTKSFLVHSGIY